MAKRFVTISLATKFRILFATAVLGIIATALVVPWLFMELLAEQGAQGPGALLTNLRLNEFIRYHPYPNKRSGTSLIADLYTSEDESGRRGGPRLTTLSADLTPNRKLDADATDALRSFAENVDRDLKVVPGEDADGRPIYRCLRAVRTDMSCMSCHGTQAPVERQFQQGQLVAIIDATLPGTAGTNWLVWWTRAAFLVGVVLAGIVASIIFAVIAQRLILRPIGHLKAVTDRAAEGDLDVRSHIRSGDELEMLGDSFNDMLAAIAQHHERLEAANDALDLKLNELAQANVTLYKANQVKSEFLANVSHELRTPLNSVIGFAELLADSHEERVSRYGLNITRAAKSLLGMINDLLDLAKIEAGKADVRFDKVSPKALCKDLIALIRPLADKKSITIEALIDDLLPIIVTDGGKLQQILFNLLSNAVKFTPNEGHVILTAQRENPDQGDEIRGIVLSVADTGPGIPQAEQSRIFEKFYRSEATLTKEASGTGLGLAISRELATLLGGRIQLKSSPGHGAEFIVYLPMDGSTQLAR